MLPFETFQEAEIFLGRNLTYSETLWFKYSARKTDYFLYFHNFMFVFLFYNILPLPWVIIELMGSKKIDKFKIQPKFNNSFLDMIMCYKKATWIGIRTSLALPSGSEMLCQILVYFIIEDYANYWLHRWMHCKWGYENIHKVHHEYTAPIGFAAPYAHWAEIIILGLAPFLGPFIVPCHILTFWLWFILKLLQAVEVHSGYEFPWSPTKMIPFYGGAIHHDYHHFVGRSSHSNFASTFTYCDYIYGTDKGYRYHKKFLDKRREESRKCR